VSLKLAVDDMKLIGNVDYWVDTNNAEETKVLQGSQTQGAESATRTSPIAPRSTREQQSYKLNGTLLTLGLIAGGGWPNRAQKGGGGARGRSRELCQGLGGTDQGNGLGRFRFLGRVEEFHRLHRLFVSRESLRGRQHHQTLGRIHHGGGRSLTLEPRNAPDETWQSEH